jgi:hypothetical protein
MNLNRTPNIDLDIALPRDRTAWLVFGGTRLPLITGFAGIGGVSGAVTGICLSIVSLVLPRSYTFVTGHFAAALFISNLSASALVSLEVGLAPLLVLDTLDRMPNDWRLAVPIQMLGFAAEIVLVLWLVSPVGPIVESAVALGVCVTVVLVLTDRYLRVALTDFEAKIKNRSEADE